MKAEALVLSDPAWKRAFDEAERGKTQTLFALLRKHSGLPGVRCNMRLADGFGQVCALRGGSLDAMLDAMLALSPDQAPGGSEYEFLPVCAVFGVSKRAARDNRLWDSAFDKLHDAADDMRFRVREAVSVALADLGRLAPSKTLRSLEPWVSGYSYASNVCEALSTSTFVDAIETASEVVPLLEGCWRTLFDAPRAAERYPAYKSLVEAIPKATELVLLRFGEPAFVMLTFFCKSKEPKVRVAIASSIDSTRVRTRFREDVLALEAALATSERKPRDPTQIVQGTRKRARRRQE